MSVLRNFVFKLLYRTGIGCLFLHQNRRQGKVPVLVFHKVIPEYDPIWPGIHPKLFEKIVQLLKKHYTILPLEYLWEKPEQDFSKACFITFDDGYKDYLDYAYPILRRHEAHSTLFVLPYDLSNKGHIWTSTIISFVKHYSSREIREFFTAQGQQINFDHTANDFALNLQITKHLCRLKQVERQTIIEALRMKFEKEGRIIGTELLSYEELRKLDPDYVTVASHSLTHPSFMLETDERFIEHELQESKQSIERELNTRVSSFAFPFGSYNEAAIRLVKKYYTICFTRINDLLDLKKLREDGAYRYDLPRYNIHHDSAEEVFFLINGFHKKFKA